MNTKKIWMLAIVFGMIMSISFYIVTSVSGDTSQTVPAAIQEEELLDHETEEVMEQSMLEIGEGKRAISLSVNEVQSVSGFVRPGSYVDAIAVMPLPVNERTTSQILLNNIRVLAVGKTVSEEFDEYSDSYQMVTLEVTPEEGAALAFANEAGTVTLMLRGSEDDEPSQRVNISLEELQKGKMPK